MINEVIAGHRQGSSIHADPNQQLAYIGTNEYLTKVLVSSVNLINSTTEVDTTKIASGYWKLGAMGALAGAQANTEILIEIIWKSGEKSIAKVTKEMFERILVGMNTEYTSESLAKVKKQEYETIRRKKEEAEEWTPGKIIFLVLLFGWVILVTIGACQ